MKYFAHAKVSSICLKRQAATNIRSESPPTIGHSPGFRAIDSAKNLLSTIPSQFTIALYGPKRLPFPIPSRCNTRIGATHLSSRDTQQAGGQTQHTTFQIRSRFLSTLIGPDSGTV